jgi:transcription elongation factor GreB
MSRAFVSESDTQFQEEDIPPIKIPLPPGVSNYMTPQGAERTRAELAILANIERPRVAGIITRLVAPGAGLDREELSAQRRRLRDIDRRIEYLTTMLARIEVIDPAQQQSDRVLFGATVTVEEPGSVRKTYRIVGIDESDPAAGRISWISPLAKALLGRREGEPVALKLPEGESGLWILKIEYIIL